MAEQNDNKTNGGETSDAIAEAMASPSSFTLDGISQSNRSISELIVGDKYRAKRSLMRRAHPFSGLCSRMSAPGPRG